MNSIDSTAEWKRLEELYGQLTEDELEAVADEGYDLTDIAKQALQAEISRRSLNINLRETPTNAVEDGDPTGDFDPAELELIVLSRVWDLSEARRTKQVLDEAGIPAYLGPDNLDDAKVFPSNFDGGIEMKVRDRDQQRALAALARAEPADRDSAGEEVVDDDRDCSARCPRCHSVEIVFQNLEAPLSGKSAFEAKYNWRCDACGLRWQDDGVEQTA